MSHRQQFRGIEITGNGNVVDGGVSQVGKAGEGGSVIQVVNVVDVHKHYHYPKTPAASFLPKQSGVAKSKCDALKGIVAAIRPINRLPLDVHLWWSRRHHALARGMIISALASPVEDVERLEANVTDFSGKVVLDPFAGSGTNVIEALRLGCFPIGIDLNPMAWWIMRNRLLRVELAALDEAIESISEACSPKTDPLYQTTCPQCSINLPAKAYVWAWISQCTTCGQRTRVLPSARLVARGDLRVFVCPACGEMVSAQKQKDVECPSCKRVLSEETSSYRRGAVICSHCGNVQSVVDEVRRTGHRLPREMLMVEVLCPEHGLLFKAPDRNDWALVMRAESLLRDLEGELPLPDLSLDFGPVPTNVQQHGYHRYLDFFSQRQLLTLGVLLKAITAVEPEKVRSTLLALFSGLLEYNCVLCEYDARRGGLRPAYARHALWLSPLSVEGNPWHQDNMGGWKGRYRRVIRPAKEQLLTDSNSLVPGMAAGWPRVTFVSDFPELQDGCVLLQCASATDLPLPDSSVDAVVTDPPYFDNVQYAFLSDFFYAWLAPVLADEHEAFSSPSTPKSAEIVVHSPPKGQQVELYVNNLKQAFSEIGRVLKQDAPLVYIYHVPSLDSFKATLQWMLDAGFYVGDFCRIEQEHRGAFHQSARETVFSADAILYCYKRGGGWPTTWQAFQKDLTRHVYDLFGEGAELSREELTETAWGKFMLQFSRSYPHVYQADGNQTSVADAVDWMWSLVSVVINSYG